MTHVTPTVDDRPWISTWYADFIFQIFYDDVNRLRDLEKTENPNKGPHLRPNCEMCRLLGKHCKYVERMQRWELANAHAAAYTNGHQNSNPRK